MVNFFYPYMDTKNTDFGWELKYSIRSLEKHFKKDFTITIIGDIPEWIDSTKVRCIKYDNNNLLISPQAKVFHKTNIMCELEKDFVMIHDDMYLIKDLSFDMLKIPRYLNILPNLDEVNYDIQPPFTKRIIDTYYALKAKRLKAEYNFCIHAPRYYESSKIRKVQRFIELDNPSGIILENVYFNFHAKNPQPVGNYRAGYWGAPDDVPITDSTFILNHNNDGIFKNPGLISYLKETFPNKSKFEL